MKKIKEAAEAWAIDYKPWENDLTPQSYAQYGFEKGVKWAIREFAKKPLNKVVTTSQEPCEKCNYWKSYDVNFDFCPECGLALDR